jgi:hypothetical protein
MTKEEFEENFGSYKWDRKNYFQGAGCIYLRHPDNFGKEAYYPSKERGDIIVAKTQRWHKVEIIEKDIMDFCPFSEFDDGFYFTHPDGRVLSWNEGATKIKGGEKGKNENRQRRSGAGTMG